MRKKPGLKARRVFPVDQIFGFEHQGIRAEPAVNFLLERLGQRGVIPEASEATGIACRICTSVSRLMMTWVCFCTGSSGCTQSIRPLMPRWMRMVCESSNSQNSFFPWRRICTKAMADHVLQAGRRGVIKSGRAITPVTRRPRIIGSSDRRTSSTSGSSGIRQIAYRVRGITDSVLFLRISGWHRVSGLLPARR